MDPGIPISVVLLDHSSEVLLDPGERASFLTKHTISLPTRVKVDNDRRVVGAGNHDVSGIDIVVHKPKTVDMANAISETLQEAVDVEFTTFVSDALLQ